MSNAHNIGDYTFAGGLFAIGMSPFQITLGILGEALIIFAGCTLSGFIGHKTGGPFPVVQRISWGLFGTNVPALIRAIVAIAWYGHPDLPDLRGGQRATAAPVSGPTVVGGLMITANALRARPPEAITPAAEDR